MLKTETILNTCALYGNEVAEEYKHKLAKYEIVENLKKDDGRLNDDYMSMCVTIPVDDIHLVNKVEGVDTNTGIANFNLFGYIESDRLSSIHVELLDMVIIGSEVFAFDRFLCMIDRDSTGFDETGYTMDHEMIHKVCIAALNSYLLQKHVGEDRDPYHYLREGGKKLKY